jgi:hypothetical protein
MRRGPSMRPYRSRTGPTVDTPPDREPRYGMRNRPRTEPELASDGTLSSPSARNAPACTS